MIIGIDPGASTGMAYFNNGKLEALRTISPNEINDAIILARTGAPVAVATGRCLWCDDIVSESARWCGAGYRDQWCKERGVK